MSAHSQVEKSRGTYDRNRGRMAFYVDAYFGGEHWRNPSSTTLGVAELVTFSVNHDTREVTERVDSTVQSYLVPHAGERLRNFNARHSLASYVNVCSPIVDSYADSATNGIQRELGAITPFLQNVDGKGKSWESLIKEVALWSGVYGFCGLLLDVPEGEVARNRAEETASRKGLRATVIHPPAIAWIDIDGDGDIVEFAFVEEAFRDSATANKEVTVYCYSATEWATWTVTNLSSSLGVSAQRGAIEKAGNAEGVKRKGTHPFGRVPVEFAYFKQASTSKFPSGVSLIADIADIAREVYNTLSNVGDIHRKTAFPFLAVPTKAAAGKLEPESKLQFGPDKAVGYSAENGRLEWVQPSAEQTAELRTHAVFYITLAYRCAGLDLSVDGTGGVASGLAIQLKSRGFESRCASFSANLQRFESAALTLAHGGLGLTPGFTLNYPTRFVLPDSAEELARAILFQGTFGETLGTEGKLKVLSQALNAAISLPDATIQKLVEEVRAKWKALPPDRVPPATPPATDKLPPDSMETPPNGD